MRRLRRKLRCLRGKHETQTWRINEFGLWGVDGEACRHCGKISKLSARHAWKR
jgi:hypothetical protein